MEMRNSQLEHGQPMEQARGVFYMIVRLRCGSLSITTPVSLRFSKRIARASVNQICVIYETMNDCKKSKDSLRSCCFQKLLLV